MASINDRRSWHSSLTDERIAEGAEEQLFGMENVGFCIECGADHDECEPDAREYECYECGKRKVYGAVELCQYS